MSDDPSDGPPNARTDRDRATDRRDARPTDSRNTDAMTDTSDETETDSTRTAPTTAPAAESATTPAAEPATAPDGGTAEDDPEPAEESGSRLSRLSSEDLRGLLDRIGLAALVLLALIAGWSFYSQTGRAIRTWLDPAYQPIALAAFNLAVLFVALAGVAHQLYRIRVGDGGTADPEPPRTEEPRASEDAER
ncbi:hypothetical protein SAMN04488066_105194 [Halorubrum aquaticum]|uniref:DUF8060 domain-containing protein n=1 Tax=Halorubrum aquaticum TaxID=387340 RepID=A0A1I3AG42_9EURY|nr:hypothetical protein [Halorubrum aquaticum]SFH49012.1 hypothetical protein SAMN04488066_105194 [Halorubrum aquaticum]